MVLPFINTFNSFLTNAFLKWHAYAILQELVVPYEAKMLAGFFNVLRFSALAVPKGVWLNGLFLEITWNCLGWQSVVLLVATFIGGFQGRFSWSSRFEVVLIGLLGTFLVNFLRIAIFGVLATTINSTTAVFFHDYLALIFVIAWFGVFWWFSYSFVLEERGSKVDEG